VSSAICHRPLALAAHGVVAILAHAQGTGTGSGSRLALHADGGAVMRHLTLDATLVPWLLLAVNPNFRQDVFLDGNE
jgi:hypothetical protein